METQTEQDEKFIKEIIKNKSPFKTSMIGKKFKLVKKKEVLKE